MVFQSGRSLIEVIAVLAIMGILSIAAYYTFRVLFDKHTAHAILENAQVAYVEMHSRQEGVPTDWQKVVQNFKPVPENLGFYIKRDPLEHDYVKVKGVEQRICYQLLNMQVEGKLAFYNDNDEKYTTCSALNDMIIVFNNQGVPAECATTTDCDKGEYDLEINPSGFNGFCNADGRCQACDPEFEEVNDDRTGCLCDTTRALSCTDGETDWCCGEGLICDIENKGCKNGGGVCMYNFTQQVQTKAANCHYFISAQTQTKAANCHYKITDTDNGNNLHSITMTLQGEACAPDEYCYIAYFDESCTSSINRGNVGATTTEDVWGTCLKRTAANTQCNISSVNTTFLEEDASHKCASDEYCYIGYFDESCSSSINRGNVGATTTEDVWGTCLKRTAANSQCNISEITLGGLSEVQGCPVGQYCSIKWEGNTCSTVINRGDVTGPMLGACIERTSNTVNQCPIQN